MDYMNFSIAINDTATLSDLLGDAKTLDVSSLKEDAAHVAVTLRAGSDEDLVQRDSELDAIEAFIAKHGVTKPTEEDYKPKSAAWGPQSKSKAEKIKENPNYVERRGRPRSSFTKVLSFVRVLQADKGLIDTDGKDEFKRAGRGRSKKGETRETFTIHHTNVEKACAGTHTRNQLVAMVQAS